MVPWCHSGAIRAEEDVEELVKLENKDDGETVEQEVDVRPVHQKEFAADPGQIEPWLLHGTYNHSPNEL